MVLEGCTECARLIVAELIAISWVKVYLIEMEKLAIEAKTFKSIVVEMKILIWTMRSVENKPAIVRLIWYVTAF